MSVVLTKSRLLNALRCYWNYALSRLGLVRISHMPLFVSVEPSSVCQLRCPECPVGMGNAQSSNRQSSDRQSPWMSREVWEKTLSEAAPYAHTIQFYFQGEPLLNKDLPTMIREAHEAGLYTIVSTNAQLITDELAAELIRAGLDRIIVSMDGLTDESYNAYRVGGSLAKCKAALRSLYKERSRLDGHTLIELQCLRLRTNEQEWDTFRQEYKHLGADRLVFKTAQLYDYQNGHPLMPSDPKYSRYIKGSDGRYRRRRLGKGCFRVWSGVVVTTAGEVLPCCYDKAHAYAYGNIKEYNLAELFTNERSVAFRQAAFSETPQICKECWR